MHAAFVRDNQGIAGIRLARARHRRSQGMLDDLGLPEPFDLLTFVDQVAHHRGREIHLVAIRGAVANGSPCGWWCPTRNFDLIFLDEAASQVHRDHIVLHEVGHMLWGHDPALAALSPILKRATSHLRWDSGAITGMLGRSEYDSPREQEAEVFATVAGLKILTARAGPTGAGADHGGPLSQALYPRVGT